MNRVAVTTVLCLCSTVVLGQGPKPPMNITSEAITPFPVTGAFADKRTSEAKGSKSCLIRQLGSDHILQQIRQAEARAGVPLPHLIRSIVQFTVHKGGLVGAAVSETTFPGLQSYFLVAGKRFSGLGDRFVDVTPAVPDLKRDAMIKYTWHKWPYRNERNGEDIFVGFSAAYAACMQFMR